MTLGPSQERLFLQQEVKVHSCVFWCSCYMFTPLMWTQYTIWMYMYTADCLETVTYQFLLLFYLHSQIHRFRVLNSLHVTCIYCISGTCWFQNGTCTCNALEHHLILQPPRSHGQLVVIVSTAVLWLEHKLAVITCTVYWPLSSHWRTPLIWLPINIAKCLWPIGYGRLVVWCPTRKYRRRYSVGMDILKFCPFYFLIVFIYHFEQIFRW